MKKQYINPTMTIVEIATYQLMTGSITDAVTETSVDPNADPITEPGGMDSRQGRGFWDDEEY